jgi:hypothetical protein
MKTAVLASLMLPMATAFCPNKCSGHGTCQNDPKDTCVCFTAKEIDIQWAATGIDVIAGSGTQPSATTLNLDNYGTSTKTASGASVLSVAGVDGLGIDTTTRNEGDLTTHKASMINGGASFEGEISLYTANVEAWTGHDCSQRACPKGMAWAAAPKADNDHTSRVECSGVGSCDRKTGQCKCAEPYTGVGCRRTMCPNECSGHGSCKSQSEIANMASHDAEGDISKIFSTPAMTDSQVDSYTGGKYDGAFDSETQYGCVCEGTWFGADCSLKACPSGADPLYGKGAAQGRACSGRGTCDTSSGLCNCHVGYFGAHCDTQTTLY